VPLQFGAGAGLTSNVSVPNSAKSQSLDPFAYWLIVKPTTLTNARVLMLKGQVANNSRRALQISGTTGNLVVTVDRATTDTSYITNDTPFATLNVWYVVLVTFSSTATPTTHIYTARLGNGFVESTYGTATDGSGALGSDAADPLIIGNNVASSGAFQGVMAFAAVFNAIPTRNNLQATNWRRISQLGSCVGAWRLGANGLGVVLDESGNGNNGTITSAFPTSDNLPLQWVARGPDFNPAWAIGTNQILSGGYGA
jgi:hypothetical protein